MMNDILFKYQLLQQLVNRNSLHKDTLVIVQSFLLPTVIYCKQNYDKVIQELKRWDNISKEPKQTINYIKNRNLLIKAIKNSKRL